MAISSFVEGASLLAGEEDPLLEDFFRFAPLSLRRRFLDSIGRGLCKLERPIDPQLELRFKALWEWRVASTIGAGGSVPEFEELTAFSGGSEVDRWTLDGALRS